MLFEKRKLHARRFLAVIIGILLATIFKNTNECTAEESV